MLTHALFITGFALYVGIVWRLRGGAFTALTSLDPGTDGARLAAAVLIAAPLYFIHHDWRALLLVPAVLIGLVLAGWGPFQGMGTENVPGYLPERSWLRALPRALGLQAGTYAHDLLGMIQAGLVCVAPAALLVAWVSHWTVSFPALVLAAGAGFGAAYSVARIGLPTIGKFVTGQAWGEVLAGAGFGAALAAAFLFN